MSHHTAKRTVAFPNHTVLLIPCIKLATNNQMMINSMATFRDFQCKGESMVINATHVNDRMGSSVRIVVYTNAQL